MRYHVKWTVKGETHYGLFSSIDQKPDKKGNVEVCDAVLPVAYLVPEKLLVDIETKPGRYDMKTGDWLEQDEYHQYVQDEYKKADKLSESLPDGVHVGSLFGVGVADGTAWYVVTKVNKRTAKVEWRGFCPDRWTAPLLGWGGSVAISQIEPLCRRAKAKLFRKKK